MAILTSTEYPAIRAAIDITLTTDDLPDSIIALPIYAAAADQDVLARDPLAESRTGAALQHVKNAATYFCAARLILALPQFTQEREGEQQYTRQSVNVADRAAELRGLAAAELDAVLDPDPGDVVAQRPTFFGRLAGGRGRW
jgi:hypothetical protein